jgi:hypothetical protein
MRFVVYFLFVIIISSCSGLETSDQYSIGYNRCFNYCMNQDTYILKYHYPDECLCYEGQ